VSEQRDKEVAVYRVCTLDLNKMLDTPAFCNFMVHSTPKETS